jgi:hypothetical protein
MMHETEQLQGDSRRKEIFQALVEAQDDGASVAESRKLIAQRYNVSEPELRKIEQEGIDQQWPPL